MAYYLENGIYRFADSGLPCDMTEEVVAHYSDTVMRIALTKTRSTHDADDIFQEVFIKMFESAKEFDSEEHRKAYILRVTVNACNSHFTAPWRKNVGTFDDVLENQLAYEENDSMLDAETRNEIYKSVLRLPDRMKEVVILYYYEEMSIKQIAEITSDNETNVKKRLSRARAKLRLELE